MLRPAGGWNVLDNLSVAEMHSTAKQAASVFAVRSSESGGAATLSRLATVRNANSQLVAGVK